MTSHADQPLPSYLATDQEVIPEHMGLQVLLLTQEVALLRTRMNLLAKALAQLGQQVSMPDTDLSL